MNTLRRLTFCLLLAGSSSLAACGDDEDDGGDAGNAGSSGEGGEGGTGGDTDGGSGSGGSGGTGGTTGGAGGTGGATGGTGGSAGDEDSGVDDDEDGGSDAKITASAAIDGVDDNELNGTVMFTANDADVSAYIQLNDCPDGSYQMHIHEGDSCDNYGPHWDTPRGVGFPNITCDNDHGEGTYVRAGTDPKPWSVDIGEEDTDVNGHTFVVHDSGGTVVACGEISVD